MPAGQHWTREEVILAMNLDTRLNFGKFGKRNSSIIQLAEHLNRAKKQCRSKKQCHSLNFAMEDGRGEIG
jgi:hypothetical protein